jgi:uncharacterized protein YjbI with pentapeptide repeats
MAKQEHLDILKRGVEKWNLWKKEHFEIRPDFREANLTGADLSGANLTGANLHWADLSRANLTGTILSRADLSRAVLVGADLKGADLSEANLSEADLIEADLSEATLIGVDLTEAHLGGVNLSKANLSGAKLVKTDLSNATLTGCKIFGVSAWKVKLDGAVQKNLQITDYDESAITVDNLEVAQFVYLLLNNQKVRDVINTITSKAVLILGRFTPERKAVLDALREELRQRDYLPILFDFDNPSSRNLTETVSTLAHISRFVIADITDAKSIPQELQRIVPNLPSLPVQPLLLSSQYEYAMFKDFNDYSWVLSLYRYDSPEALLSSLAEKVIDPAEAKAKEIEERRKAFEREVGR